jgi:hypothetical protein
MGKIATPYESVLAKWYKHGRVTVARNMNQQIANFATGFSSLPDNASKALALRAVCGDMSRICKEAAGAQEFDASPWP